MCENLVSSAFALLFTEISVTHTTEISVKSSAKAEDTSLCSSAIYVVVTIHGRLSSVICMYYVLTYVVLNKM